MFCAAYGCFPATAPNGLAGRILASYGNQLVLQNASGLGCNAGGWTYSSATMNTGSGSVSFPQLPPMGDSNFSLAATVTDDPSVSYLDTPLIGISPNGQRIAVGMGITNGSGDSYYVFLFDTSILSPSLNLMTDSRVWKSPPFTGLSSLAWVGSNQVAVLWGDWTDSYVETLPSSGGTFTHIMHIPGAAGSIAVDQGNNLFAGIGLYIDPSSGADRTGEIRIIPANNWPLNGIDEATPSSAGAWPLDFTANGLLLAKGIGSALSLGVDGEGDLYASGTDGTGINPPTYGTVFLLRNDAIARVLQGGQAIQGANPADYRTLSPDPAQYDWSEVVFTNPVTDSLEIVWDPDEYFPGEWITDNVILTSYAAR